MERQSGGGVQLKPRLKSMLHDEAARRGLTVSQALEEAVTQWVGSKSGPTRTAPCLHPLHRRTDYGNNWICDTTKGGCGFLS